MANHVTLKGEHILLREPKETDKEDRYMLGIDSEFRRMVGGDSTATKLTWSEVEEWYENKKKEPHSWMMEYQGRCIGTARLHTLDSYNKHAWFAIGIWD
jgi:hypothetical protein